MTRQLLLLAVLVYVTLDLSMAGMPGAFVFDPADSVESAHGARARGTGPLVVAAPCAGDIATAAPTPPPSGPTPTAVVVVPRALRVVSCLPRAVLAPALSEDPH